MKRLSLFLLYCLPALNIGCQGCGALPECSELSEHECENEPACVVDTAGCAEVSAEDEPTCEDGVNNGDEEGVDCGGPCEECLSSDACDILSNEACENQSGCIVDAELGCVDEPAPPGPACDDSEQNGDEEGVDCGGSCEACIVVGCMADSECESFLCNDDGSCAIAICGDGVNNGPDEDCDDGGESITCNIDCTAAACGDGLLNSMAGEFCDDGAESAVCNANCTEAICGDGVINASANEECDGGPGCTDMCDLDLQPSVMALTNRTCAISVHGDVRCWGSGYLGYGFNETIDGIPNTVENINIGGVAVQLAGGDNHTCVLLSTGNVKCWGRGNVGQLGGGNVEDVLNPVNAPEVQVGGKVIQITAGGSFTCALLEAGNVRCWGSASAGTLGYGNFETIGDDEAPANAGDIDLGGSASYISSGGSHSCAVLTTGAVVCWGAGIGGKLGYGGPTVGNPRDIGDTEHPSEAGAINLGGIATQVTAGNIHTCALLEGGTVRCWGANDWGQLGYGNQLPLTTPNLMDVDVGGSVKEIVAGLRHTCAILDDGRVRCWGQNLSGILGYGNGDITIGDDESPSTVGDVDVGGTVAQISVSQLSTCVVVTTGGIKCWGQSSFGQLGYGNDENIGDDEVPSSVGEVQVFE